MRRSGERPDPADLPTAEAQQDLRLHPTFDGWWNGTFHLSPDDGHLLTTLIDGEVDGYLRAARDGDPSLVGLSMGALRAKALVDLATRAARRAPGEVSAPDRYRVGIVFPLGTDHVPAAACDADLYRLVLGADSEPLDVGRTTKRWSTAIRRAITHRDRHWTDGGSTSTTNGTLLCRHHHTFIHEQRWLVHLDQHQQAIFTRSDGTEHRPVTQRPRC